MKKSDIPNLISFLRLLLIIPVVWYLLAQRYEIALILFALAGLSDAVDGHLARKYNWSSHLGGWLDPLADKAMQVSVYVCLAWLQLIPWWLLSAVIIRDLLIVGGGVFYYYRVEKVNAAPSMISKLNTLMQIVLVIIVLLHMSIYPLPDNVIDTTIYLVFVTTVLSGLDYVFTWGIKAWHIKKG